MKSKFLLGVASGLAVLLASGSAFAQSAGSIVVYGGAAQITPQVDSGDLTAPSLAGTKVDVKKATSFVGGITYYWSDNISIDLPIAAPFKHDIVGAGAIDGVGKLGTVKSLPMTLLAQYRFGEANSVLRPFIGAGPTYGYFYKPRATAVLSGITGGTVNNPTTLKMKSRLGATVELGAAYNITHDWSASLSVTKTFIKTTGTLSTGQTIETTLDPVSIKFGIGYRF
ncbi:MULTISPECIES: OmpW/AlkL family protein [Roseateles]|uniref:Outer membrane beta-barrel protein n=1 Tax=Pelomonas caseinilytica TaxID=2906763 RepID=A0ABS8XGZ8_9BURK|nr:MULTISPECIES: OmpW family outer membrane protein [unclassified Roseateles]MCE4540154.1 outer membrane beta-barrel protein [Pelomonas sp. P7]HEV6966366.1 OmpW family outer membrane protein [Roseateles sp.]